MTTVSVLIITITIMATAYAMGRFLIADLAVQKAAVGREQATASPSTAATVPLRLPEEGLRWSEADDRQLNRCSTAQDARIRPTGRPPRPRT